MLHVYKIENKNKYNGPYWDEQVKINAEPIIYLYGRDENKNKIVKEIRGFKPYFYVESNKVLPEIIMQYIVGVEDTEYISVKGERCKKIFTQNPKNVKTMREILNSYNIKTFEDDIVYVLRFLIDEKENMEKNNVMDLKNVNFRKMFIDIEVPSETFPHAKDANEKITLITNYDNYTKTYYVFGFHEKKEYWEDKLSDIISTGKYDDKLVKIKLFDNEYEMLNEWLDFFEITNPDLLLTWYGEQFDIPYIINRLDRLKIDKRRLAVNRGWVSNWLRDDKWFQSHISGRVLFDMYKYYRNTVRSEKPSYSLDNVSRDELGESKDPITNHLETYRNDFRKYLLYNIKDVELCVKLEEKRGLVNFINGIRELIGCNFEDFFYFSRLIDLMILNYAKKHNIILPSRRSVEGEYVPKDKREVRFKGAHVLAVQGLYDNVCGLDIKTLYPYIIKSLNISYETIREDGKGEIKIGEYTYDKKPGLLARVVDDVLKVSEEYKELKKNATTGTFEYENYSNLYECVKFIVVTLYGAQGNNTFRLFDTRNAASITRVGREIIQHTQKIIEKEGHKVIVMDTDSCYFTLTHTNKTNKECIDEGHRVRDLINKSYDEFVKRYNIDSHNFEIKFEKFFSKMIVGTNKRYAGRQIWSEGDGKDMYRDGKWEDYLHITGFEAVRSNYSRKTREMQPEVFKMFLYGKGYEKVKEYLFSICKGIAKDEFKPTDMGLPTPINSDEYVSNLPIVRGQKWSNNNIHTNFGVGDKILIMYVIHPETDVIAYEYDYQFDKARQKGMKVDTKRMIERTVFMPLVTTFEAVKQDLNKLREEWKMMVSGQQKLM